jgi:hypothetical protein
MRGSRAELVPPLTYCSSRCASLTTGWTLGTTTGSITSQFGRTIGLDLLVPFLKTSLLAVRRPTRSPASTLWAFNERHSG